MSKRRRALVCTTKCLEFSWYGTKMGFQHETHGKHIAIENQPTKHICDSNDCLDNVDQRPAEGWIIHGCGYGKPKVENSSPVFTDGIVHVDDGHVLFLKRRIY